ncbi:MAG TPA: hypothetical protein VFI47_03160 [Acidimicrobiales bacterium]|nr:hypothetical protein [Acidimicrobiales bacterium]
MELASYLAGERWSDHPSCTHPLLATLARLVNDHTSDAGRERLGPLVPAVIGLAGDDPRVDVELALRAARTALPVAAAERQRVMAVSVIAAERALAEIEGRPGDRLGDASRRALAQVPLAADWARRFTHDMGGDARGFRRHAAQDTVRYAVVSIARACIVDPDALLFDLLSGAIADCERLLGRAPGAEPAVDAAQWADACRLTYR